MDIDFRTHNLEVAVAFSKMGPVVCSLRFFDFFKHIVLAAFFFFFLRNSENSTFLRFLRVKLELQKAQAQKIRKLRPKPHTHVV